MKNTTFCVLLAATLMLMGAAAGAFMKMDEKADDMRQASAPADERERVFMIMPIAGEVLEPFGVKYSAEYGQWSLAESVLVAADATQTVRAPMDCTVEAIEALEGGGSCVTLTEGNVRIRLQPVYNLRVFEGSRLEVEDAFAESKGLLEIYMEREGRSVDPEKELTAGDDEELIEKPE